MPQVTSGNFNHISVHLEPGFVSVDVSTESDVTAPSEGEESANDDGREECGKEDEVKQRRRAVVLEQVAREPRAQDRPARARRERHARQRRCYLETGCCCGYRYYYNYYYNYY